MGGRLSHVGSSWRLTPLLGLALAIAFVSIGAGGTDPAAEPVPAASDVKPAEKPPPDPPKPAQKYVGTDVCFTCHPQQDEEIQKSPMGKILLKFPRSEAERHGCEACHGPRSLHVKNPTDPQYWQGLLAKPAKTATAAKQSAVCLACHNKKERMYWQGGVHDREDLTCIDCHDPHKPLSEEDLLTKPTEFELCGECHIVKRSQLLRTSHMPLRESKMTCSDCHNPHGSQTPPLIDANSKNDLCYECHAQRRGPFLWEHPPVTEDCMNCHDPHGSINDYMLVRKPERLCQECHITNRHSTQPHDYNTVFVFDRSCANCHANLHGSNHPSGAYFLR